MPKLTLLSKGGIELHVEETEESQTWSQKIIEVHDQVIGVLGALLGGTKDGVGKPIGGGFTGAPRMVSKTIAPTFTGLEAEMMPTRLTEQPFIIDEVNETEDGVEITCSHMTYQLSKAFTKFKGDSNTSYSVQAVINAIMDNLITPEDAFTICTDSDATIKGKDLDFDQKNVIECFLDPKKGLCKTQNLVMLRNGWHIFLIKEDSVGYDRGFVVEYAKNLLSVNRNESIDETVTRIVPYGKQGKNVKYIQNGLKYVDSPHIGKYHRPRAYLLDTGIVLGKDGVTTQNWDEKLREAAQKKYDEDKVDVPSIEMDIDFLSMGDTEEYAQYRDLDKVYLYDKITIKDRKRGYNYSAEVVGITHNVITGQLESVKIGSINNSDGIRKISTWQVPTFDGGNIRLQTILQGTLADGAVDSDALAEGAVTGAKIAELAIGTAHIDDAAITTAKIEDATITSAKIGTGEIKTANIDDAAITSAKIGDAQIGDAKIDSAGIGYAKIKELDAESAFVGDAILQRTLADKLYAPRLMFDTAQGRQLTVQDMVIGSSDGHYYQLDISIVDGSPVMTPTEVTPTAGEIAQGHTSDGRAIIGTTATYQELCAETIFGVDAVIDKITAKRIDVDELWARQAFINALNVQDLSSNTYIRATVGSWSGTATIKDKITGIEGQMSSLGRGQIFYTATEPENPAEGDLWIRPTTATTWQDIEALKWRQLEDYKWQDLGLPTPVFCYDGQGWQPVNDTSQITVVETQIEQMADRINLKASQSDVDLMGQQVTANTAQISVHTDAIESEVERALNAENGKISKTANYQTADSIVTAAQTYTDGKLSAYSTITQTDSKISAEVTKIEDGTTAVGKVHTSKVDITANGISLATGGTFTVASANFSIDSSGNVTLKGRVEASAGKIGGWTIGTNALYSGSGSTYVNINSNPNNTYCIYAGSSTASSAPFRVKRDGSVYLTNLVSINEGGRETTVNLTNAPLWKLNIGSVIRSASVSGNTLTLTPFSGGAINFSKPTSTLSLTGGWGGNNTFTATAQLRSDGAVTETQNISARVTTNLSQLSNGYRLTVFGEGGGGATLYQQSFVQDKIINVYLIYNSDYESATLYTHDSTGYHNIGSGFVKVIKSENSYTKIRLA